MSGGWEAVRIEDLDSISVAGVVWHPVRRRLGIRAFGMNAYSAEGIGQQIVEKHDETSLGHEEVYAVIRGTVAFTIGDDTFTAEAPTLVFISDTSLKRVGIAESADALVLAVGNAPGKAYEPSSWEESFAAAPLIEAGRFDEAIAMIAGALRDHPGDASVLYNLACAESRAGRTADAIAHLTEAIAANDKYIDAARKDPDFDAIRGEPGFPA